MRKKFLKFGLIAGIVALVLAITLINVLPTASKGESANLDQLPKGPTEPSPDVRFVEEDILAFFDNQVKARLSSIPIQEHPAIDTVLVQTIRWVDSAEDVTIWVSTRWAEFSDEFKRDLLVHECLHILEAESGIDIGQFYLDVQRWYNDPTSGLPGPLSGENYVKYVLWHWLYSGKSRYEDSERGIEEFAYIGTQLVRGRGYEVSETILDYYREILDGAYLD